MEGMPTGEYPGKAFVEEGISLCRRGFWAEGSALLTRAMEGRETGTEFPGLAYTYFGVAIAKLERRRKDGLKLCEHGVRIQFYEPENHLNLARVHLMMNNRRGAVDAIARGLKIDPHHAGLRQLRKEIGVRRPPVVPFLSRDNPINRVLGRIRHDLVESGEKKTRP